MTDPNAVPAHAPAMPAWMIGAHKEIGVRELPENRGPDIRRYLRGRFPVRVNPLERIGFANA